MSERGYAIVGLGYVGLPVALAFARVFDPVLGFDVSFERIAELRRGEDHTREVVAEALRSTSIRLTDDPAALGEASFVVVAVPHRRFRERPLARFLEAVAPRGAVVDVKSALAPIAKQWEGEGRAV